MKPDLIISWPKNNDYPVWREMVRSHRHRISDIIIVFTETNDGVDFSPFVKKAMVHEGCKFINQPPVRSDDWRNVAVNEALLHSHSDRVWFTEQDFFVLDGFWDEVDKNAGYDVIAAYQADRLHPCCIFMGKAALNLTCRNFGIVPNVSDHFSLIQKDIQELGMSVHKMNPKTYRHLNGLSQNFNLLRNGQLPNYEPETFKNYLRACLMATVPIDDGWRKIAETYV